MGRPIHKDSSETRRKSARAWSPHDQRRSKPRKSPRAATLSRSKDVTMTSPLVSQCAKPTRAKVEQAWKKICEAVDALTDNVTEEALVEIVATNLTGDDQADEILTMFGRKMILDLRERAGTTR